MASSVEMSPKKQKVSESEDRISNLPECILSHILSFLPTKDAVRTSILSTRWVYLWTSITHDDTLLYSDKKPQRKCFSDFVSRVLLHLTNSTIESCFLDVAYSYDPTLVNIWFSAILNRRVRKFIIHGSSHKDFSSQPLFSCKSLVELVLNISCYLRVPADVNLPNLETLDLSGIRFTSNLNELVLSFPLLKKFECQNCTWSNVQNVSLQVPALEVVVLKFGGSVYVANTCTIKFCNSRLTDFSYDGSTSQDYVLLNPPSDIHVFINILVPQYRLEEEEEKEISLRACMLLKQFSQVEYLKLGQTKVFAKALGSLEDFPAFMMLRHLELGYVTGEMLLELLLKSPNLTTLDIKGISEFETELLGSAFVPHCLSSTLEVVKLGMHKGHDFEFCVAKFVMEHALVLKRLSFSWYSHQLKCKTKRVKDKLFSFKKASNTAIIEFS